MVIVSISNVPMMNIIIIYTSSRKTIIIIYTSSRVHFHRWSECIKKCYRELQPRRCQKKIWWCIKNPNNNRHSKCSCFLVLLTVRFRSRSTVHHNCACVRMYAYAIGANDCFCFFWHFHHRIACEKRNLCFHWSRWGVSVCSSCYLLPHK